MCFNVTYVNEPACLWWMQCMLWVMSQDVYGEFITLRFINNTEVPPQFEAGARIPPTNPQHTVKMSLTDDEIGLGTALRGAFGFAFDDLFLYWGHSVFFFLLLCRSSSSHDTAWLTDPSSSFKYRISIFCDSVSTHSLHAMRFPLYLLNNRDVMLGHHWSNTHYITGFKLMSVHNHLLIGLCSIRDEIHIRTLMFCHAKTRHPELYATIITLIIIMWYQMHNVLDLLSSLFTVLVKSLVIVMKVSGL